MRKLLLRWLANAVGVYAAIALVPGIRAGGGWGVYFGVALILGLVNAIVAPLVRLLTCPLILLTLGLFSLVINALMLLLTAMIAASLGLAFAVDGWLSALLGSLVISLVSMLLGAFLGVNGQEDEARR
jgi:putative membrane protein